jgi:hypothetical protein
MHRKFRIVLSVAVGWRLLWSQMLLKDEPEPNQKLNNQNREVIIVFFRNANET